MTLQSHAARFRNGGWEGAVSTRPEETEGKTEHRAGVQCLAGGRSGPTGIQGRVASCPTSYQPSVHLIRLRAQNPQGGTPGSTPEFVPRADMFLRSKGPGTCDGLKVRVLPGPGRNGGEPPSQCRYYQCCLQNVDYDMKIKVSENETGFGSN